MLELFKIEIFFFEKSLKLMKIFEIERNSSRNAQEICQYKQKCLEGMALRKNSGKAKEIFAIEKNHRNSRKSSQRTDSPLLNERKNPKKNK